MPEQNDPKPASSPNPVVPAVNPPLVTPDPTRRTTDPMPSRFDTDLEREKEKEREQQRSALRPFGSPVAEPVKSPLTEAKEPPPKPIIPKAMGGKLYVNDQPPFDTPLTPPQAKNEKQRADAWEEAEARAHGLDRSVVNRSGPSVPLRR